MPRDLGQGPPLLPRRRHRHLLLLAAAGAVGAIPAEATVLLSQRRGDDLPLPLALSTSETSTRQANGSLRYDLTVAPVDIGLDVRIDGLRIDGRSVDVGGACRTTAPARLRLGGNGYTGLDPAERIAITATPESMSRHYVAGRGGRLEGEVDIPPFAGCGTADDVSALLTATVSGPGNPVALQLGGPNCVAPVPLKGLPTGTGGDVSRCFGSDPASDPARQAFDRLAAPAPRP